MTNAPEREIVLPLLSIYIDTDGDAHGQFAVGNYYSADQLRTAILEDRARAAQAEPVAEPEPMFYGRWHHGNGNLCCGTMRYFRADFDTNPAPDVREGILDWVCTTMNAALDRWRAEKKARESDEPFAPPAAAQPPTHAAGPDSEAAFKNFHRSLCARFGYTHDEKDWRRDLVSLEEYIARLVQPESPDVAKPEFCPHADPFVYCDGCKVDPCPLGLGGKK